MSCIDNGNEFVSSAEKIISILKEARQFREPIQNKQDVFEVITTIKQTPKDWSFASVVNLNGQRADEFAFPAETKKFAAADSPPTAFLEKAAQAHLDQSQKVREFIGKGTGSNPPLKKWLIVLLIIGVLVGVGIWLYDKNNNGGKTTPTPTPNNASTPTVAPTPSGTPQTGSIPITPPPASLTPYPLASLPDAPMAKKDWISWFSVEYRPVSADTPTILADHGVMFTGDTYKITLTTIKNGYFYLFQLDSSGRARRLFPMKDFDGIILKDNENPLPATMNKILPSVVQSFELDDVVGTEALYLCAYEQRQDWLEDFQQAWTTIDELLQHTGNSCAKMLTFEHHAKK